MRRKPKNKLRPRRGIFKLPLYILTASGLIFLSVLLSRPMEKLGGLIVSRLAESDRLADRILSEELPFSDFCSYPSEYSSDTLVSARGFDDSSFAPAAGTDPAEFADQNSADPAQAALLLSLKPITAITIAPSSPSGYEYADSVYIKNETSYDIDVAASLAKKIEINMSDKNASVLILHTHGSESYSADGRTYYTAKDSDRSDDNSQNVVAVGERLAQTLKKNGINVIHLTRLFDRPDYNSAYSLALDAISEQLKKNPSIKIIIDLHRDAMVTSSGEKYKTVCRINDKDAAQLMFVCGSAQGVLPHPKWQQNLRLAIRLQQKLNELYPGLMRPINLRASRFNQHCSSGAMLVEIGTSGNTLQEALYSAELFGGALSDFLKSL